MFTRVPSSPPLHYTNQKSSYLTNNTLRQWSVNCGPRFDCGPFSTFYWVAQHLLLWAVWYVRRNVLRRLLGIKVFAGYCNNYRALISWRQQGIVAVIIGFMTGVANQSETKSHIFYCVTAKSHIIHMGTHEHHPISSSNLTPIQGDPKRCVPIFCSIKNPFFNECLFCCRTW